MDCAFFSKDEVGMALRAFTRQAGIPNEVHFDRSAEQMVPHSDFKRAIRELSIKWINSEPCSHRQNCADNMIGIIKGKWKRRTIFERIPKNCWSFGLAWEDNIYSCTSYKDCTTGV